jgi:methionyl aminopeptidase
MKKNLDIRIKTDDEIKVLREAGQILARILNELKCSLTVGDTTAEIEARAEALILASGAKSAFKGYRGYPACTCLSLNEEVVHGIPGPRAVKDGDILSIDIGIIHNRYYSDMAATFALGDIDSGKQRLIDITRQALYKGIQEARPGNRLGDISSAIQKYVESKGFSVVRDYVGHGIGLALHEDPEIPNYGVPNTGPVLKRGMVFAIEPMVNMGTFRTRTLSDGWTVVTQDRRPSAHFEHTVAVTESEPRILTE